ncbi:MAG: hypothetical protein K940chlam3_01026 [Chlamydiae bacterium]|nr:hypothetical protein [Chlamydiota bacterium]
MQIESSLKKYIVPMEENDEKRFVRGKDYKCEVEDYTGLATINGKTRMVPNTSSSPYPCVVYIPWKWIPSYEVEIGDRELRTDRKFLQPGFDLVTDSDKFHYVYSDKMEIRQIDPNIIEIYEHDIRGDECRLYVDTSDEYSAEDRVFYFGYKFIPQEISATEAQEKCDEFIKTVSLLEYRCIYNKFGLVIEGFDEEGKYKIYFSRPKEESFKEVKVRSNLSSLLAKRVQKVHEKAKAILTDSDKGKNKRSKLTHKNPPGYYGESSGNPILVNYFAKGEEGDERSIVAHIDGLEAKTLAQTDGFRLPYMVGDWV